MKRAIWFLCAFLLPCEANNWRPKILESGLLFLVVGVLILLKFFDMAFLLYLPKSAFFADVTKNQLLELTNEERQRLGLPALQSDPVLEKAAYLKGQDMMAKGYFAHNSPSGVTPWYWFRAAGYSYRYAGENLAIGFADSQELHTAWDNSPAHRENILNPNYKEIGIAVLRGNFEGAETYVVVQLFGAQKSQPLTRKSVQAAAPKPTIVQPPPAPNSQPTVAAAEKITEIEGESSFSFKTEDEQTVTEQPAPPTASNGNSAASEDIIKNIPSADQNVKLTASPVVSFLTRGYPLFVEKTIAFFVIFMIALLLMSIFVRFETQHKDLISRAIGIIVFMAILLSADKSFILQLIPHNLLI